MSHVDITLEWLPIIQKTKKDKLDFGAVTMFPKKDAFKMASETPAELLGVKKGKIQAGYDCDLIVLNDDEELDKIIVNGVII